MKKVNDIPKVNIKALEKSGEFLENIGKDLQSKYMDGIKAVLRKMKISNRKGAELSEEELDKVAKYVFMAMLATVGITIGISGVSSMASNANNALGYGKYAVVGDRVGGTLKAFMKLDGKTMWEWFEKLIPTILGKSVGFF
jgi:hypothetical protein